MDILLSILSLVVGLGSLVCFVLVVIQMFKHGQTGLGVISIVLLFCFGIGALIAFIYGWIKANEWNIKNVMLIWTVLIGISILLNIIGVVVGVSMLPQQNLQ